MAKMVRLKPVQMRIYRQNVSVAVNAEGEKVREVLPIEEKTLFELTEKCNRSRPPRAHAAQMTHEDGRVVLAEVKPEKLGRNVIVYSFLDGNKVIAGRDYFKAQMLKEHGPCQLRNINGSFMASLRDPNAERPKPESADTTAPSPEHCQCRQYAGRESGRHHFVCQWNPLAPDHEKASEKGGSADMEQVTVAPVVEPAPQPRFDGVQHTQVMNPVVTAEGPVVQAKSNPLAPSELVDPKTLPPISAKIVEIDPVPTALAEKPGAAHPPTEEVAATPEGAVVVKAVEEDPMVLMNLQGNPRIVRVAAPDEIEEALNKEATDGTPSIKLGRRDYMVVLKSEAEAALRGEYDVDAEEDEPEEDESEGEEPEGESEAAQPIEA